MRQTRTFLFLTLGLLLLFSDILPTYAAPTLQSTPRPSPTYKVCHLCGEDVAAAITPQPDGVAHAVLFWINGCGHCEDVRTQTLPPLQARLESFSSVAAVAGAEETLAPLSPTPVTMEAMPAPSPEPPPLVQKPARANGFGLAIAVMIFMALVLVYTPIALVVGKSFSLPAWADWLIPVLIVIGIGVAAYLSYVETKMVEAACGPIGDCNTVQASRYSKLFGILPVGLLGLAGYIGLLAAWLVRRFIPRLEKTAVLAFWGMAFFAVSFSLYLTYLEPFVIRAVCIWCLSSAVIVTLLLLLGTLSAVRLFAMPED